MNARRLHVEEQEHKIAAAGQENEGRPLEDFNEQATLSIPKALIEVEHLSRVINVRARKVQILDDVTFPVPAQSLFAINGPSGSGKSTILNMLTGIDRPSSGRVLFAGQELRVMGENALARWRGKHVGIVFQFFQLIPTLTALENVQLALELGGGGGLNRRQWRERAMTCLEMARIQEHANRLPSELSGGEQQRVAIARALANDPPVIVADEPTGNLDSRTAHQIFETLASLTQHSKTVIYVTHDRALASQATARIELLDGRIASVESSLAKGAAPCVL
jgi:putative ABC transport system ATP-binding protein